MKQKRKAGFFLGLILIVSMLVGFGKMPAISHAVTSTANQTSVAALNTQLIQMLIEMIRQLQAQLQQLIAAKNTTTVQCGWCGNSCINWAGKDRSSTMCADVMPPTGSYCQNINGTCQITNNTTKYSCSTAMGTVPGNNYTGCIPSNNGTFNSLAECQNVCPTSNCIGEGKSASPTSTVCCPGLIFCPSGINFSYEGGVCQKEACTTNPNVTIISPNGGETLQEGTNYTIKWTARNIPINAKIGIILLRADNANIPIISGLASTQREYTWKVNTVGNWGVGYKNASSFFAKLFGLNSVQASNPAYQIMISVNWPTYQNGSVGNVYDKSDSWFYINLDQSSCIDTCTDSRTIRHECANSSTQNYSRTCPSGYGCQGGVCIPTTVVTTKPSASCTDSDGGQSFNIKGAVTGMWCSNGACTGPIFNDTCVSSTVLQEQYCDANNNHQSVTYACPNGCENGACKAATVVTTKPLTSCTDSDNGQDFYVKGTTTGMASNNVSTTDTDYCSGNNLVEWFCSGVYRTNTNYVCPNGCENGACKPVTVLTTRPASTITCTDTDGGDSRYQKGTITIKTAAGGQWNYTDSCQDSSTVQEYSCLANPNTYLDSNAVSAYMLSYLTCGVGETCYDGACKIMGSYLKSPCGNYGDTDLDGYVTSSDTEIVANYPIMLSRLSSEQRLRADVNGDGVVDSLDTLLVSRYVAKLDTTFPVCAPKTTTGCSWCGNTCVLSSTLVGKQCADVMPPTGSTCTLVNGVCTASNGGVVEGVETHIFSENLGYGMENDDVRALQSILAAKGYFSSIISGYFGWQTEEAVKAFQSANNLPTTGLVGPLTRELLNK